MLPPHKGSNLPLEENHLRIERSDQRDQLFGQHHQRGLLESSLHEPNHVEKVFYHYYSFLKKGGICIIDDISWLPYSKNQERDKEFSEYINRSTFKKILEIFNQNKKNFDLEFYFRDSGYAIITKNEENYLNKSKKIKSREFGIKNLLRKIYKRKPIN